jgi:hypothetical protein
MSQKMREIRTSREAMLASFRQDKAVPDNIVESWLCIDCGTNTHPGALSGAVSRVALALDGEYEVTHTTETEVFDVRDSVWERAGMRTWNGCLCIGCLEKRIGRKLRRSDFSQHDKECWAALPCTDRLRSRRGLPPQPPRTFTMVADKSHLLDWSEVTR